jgi:plasmid stabilization system protein ParE
MGYQVLLGEQPREFLDGAEEKTDRIVRDHLQSLAEGPGAGRGDREQLPVDGEALYRMHISRTYTALYTVDDGESAVRVREILPIDDAHKRYGH